MGERRKYPKDVHVVVVLALFGITNWSFGRSGRLSRDPCRSLQAFNALTSRFGLEAGASRNGPSVRPFSSRREESNERTMVFKMNISSSNRCPIIIFLSQFACFKRKTKRLSK